MNSLKSRAMNFRGVARHREQQVLRLAGTVWQGERTQRLDSAGFLDGGLGEAGDRQLPFKESAGGLPAIDVHDAGFRHRGEIGVDITRGEKTMVRGGALVVP